MKVLLVRPPITLTVARRLQAFLHLEPLALEIVAGGIPSPHETRILDLACEKSVDGAFLRSLAEFKPDVIGFTGLFQRSRDRETPRRAGQSRIRPGSSSWSVGPMPRPRRRTCVCPV